MSEPDEGDLFTPEQWAEIRRAARSFVGRDGSIVLRYKRGQLAAIRYCLPGSAKDLREAVQKLREAGSYGEVVIVHTPNSTSYRVEISREYPLRK